jgi:hypothetical protein
MTEKIGFLIIYRHPDDEKKFDKRYQKHLRVFEEQIGNVVESAEVLKVDDEVFYQYGIVKFKPGTDFDTVMESPEMKVVGDDVLDFVPEMKFQIIPITQTLYEG